MAELVATGAMDLLERCQRDDAVAWREFFARWAPQIYRWAVLLGLERSRAEDAAQDVLATAARRIKRCHDERAVTSWLYQITRRVVANQRRLGWFRRRLPFSTSQSNGQEAAFDHEDHRDLAGELEVRRCLGELPVDLAEILVMTEVVGLTRTEAAGVLGIPVGTVASRTRRARAAFIALWHRDDDASVTVPPKETT